MFGAYWTTSGVIIFGSRGGLLRVPAAGGLAETVVEMSPEEDAGMPFVLPGETHVLFDTNNPGRPGPDIMIAALTDRSEKPRVLIENAREPLYTRTGHLLYVQANALMAVPFDLERVESALVS